MNDFADAKNTDSGPVNAGQEAQNTIVGEISEKDIAVYVIPKKFLNAGAPAQKAKSVGLLILIVGGALLVVGAVWGYFYIFNSSGSPTGEESRFFENGQPALEKAAEQTVLDQEKNANKTPEIADETASSAVHSEKAAGDAGEFFLKTDSDNAGTSSDFDGQPAEPGTTTIAISEPDYFQPAEIDWLRAPDSDQDGLFDKEEALLGANILSRDSDGDGYDDLSEVLALYNPAGSGRIMANENIERYENNRLGYALYYIASWRADKAGGDESIIFYTNDNQFVQVISVEKIDSNESLADWYKANSGTYHSASQMVYKKGWEGIRSADSLTVYLTKPGIRQIIVMTYNLGERKVIDYKNLFEMMVNSLEKIN